MVGREVAFAPDRGRTDLKETRLQLHDVHCDSDSARPGLRGVSLDVCSGEILGIAGVSGNGQRELAEVITGLRKVTAGHIALEGKDVTGLPAAELTERMLSYIPEERMRDGMIREFTISENMILREHQKLPFSRFGFLDLPAITRYTDDLIDKFHVKTPSRDTLAKDLSGGNIQKVVLARRALAPPTRDRGGATYAAASTSAPRNMCEDGFWSSGKPGQRSC